MKNIPKAYIYLAVAIATGLLVWFWEKPTEDKKGNVLNQPIFSELDASKVDAITIEHLLNGVWIKNQGGQWMVSVLGTKESSPPPGIVWHKVAPGKVDTALDILRATHAVSLAGNNPERHGFFETNATGEHVRLFNRDGKVLEDFYIGKAGAVFLEGYIRKEGENEVYLADRFLKTYFPDTVEIWRDHTIWDTSVKNIKVIKIEHGNNIFSIKYETGKWQRVLPKGDDLKQETAEALANQLSKIMATGFEDDATAKTREELAHPTIKITLTTDALPYVLKIGAKNDKNEYFAIKDGDVQIYLLHDSFINSLPEKLP